MPAVLYAKEVYGKNVVESKALRTVDWFTASGAIGLPICYALKAKSTRYGGVAASGVPLSSLDNADSIPATVAV